MANSLSFRELQAAIKETNDYHSREIERLPQQSQAQIEHLLSCSIKQNKVLEIQLNSLDEYERVKPSIRGVFRGMAEFDVVLIEDQQIDFTILGTYKYMIFTNGRKTNPKTDRQSFFRNKIFRVNRRRKQRNRCFYQ